MMELFSKKTLMVYQGPEYAFEYLTFRFFPYLEPPGIRSKHQAT